MPLQLGSRTAVLTGVVTIEDAESLATWFRAMAGARAAGRVNLGACSHLHTAVLQVLLAARARVSVPPADPFLRAWVAPLLGPVPRKPEVQP